jgi:hypothetical protein
VADRSFDLPSDATLESALRELGNDLAWPEAQPAAGAPDLARRVRARIVAAPPRPASARIGWRPARRALVLALAALLVLAAVAAAVAFGVPGIRLSFGTPPATATPTATPPASTGPTIPPGPPGSRLGLGEQIDPDEAADAVPFPVRLPADPVAGEPDAAYRSVRDELTFTWAPSDTLPATIDPGVGLLLTEFRGRHDPEAINKIIDSGTNVARVTVSRGRGFWIDGDPHFSFYLTPEGRMVDETRRWVGDALIWSEGEITYRLETSLGRDAAIRIAESMR